MEINQFVAVTDDPEFCLGTTLLYIDTRNNMTILVKTPISLAQRATSDIFARLQTDFHVL